MKLCKGQTAILTGASRGLGVYIARNLAAQGLDLVLAARSQRGLEATAKSVRAQGVSALVVPTDVRESAALEQLVTCAQERFGKVDVLVNNAGIWTTAAYPALTLERITKMIEVNLRAPMLLTRLVLPGMLERDTGHIVNIGSIAGLLASTYNEPYHATKFGVVGFTRSLRLTLKNAGSGVSASVVCPGFIDDAGMYKNFKQTYGLSAPRWLEGVPAQQVADAVIHAIQADLPEVIVSRGQLRLLMGISAMAPQQAEKLNLKLDATKFYREAARQKRDTRRMKAA